MKRLSHVMGAAALVALVWACSGRGGQDDRERGAESDKVTALAEPKQALSEELMLALSLAKNYHHKADVYLQQARPADAIDQVRQILTIDFPSDTYEGEDVMLDARARLAKLLVTQGAIDEAMQVVEEGIASTSRRSFFVANLHTVRGEVFEARAISLDESDAEAAKEARHEAIRAFDRAIEIEKGLLSDLAEKGAQ